MSEREEYVPRHMKPAGVMEPAPRPSKNPVHMGVAAGAARVAAGSTAAPAHMRVSEQPANTASPETESESDRQARVGRSQLLISVCVAISRITGFIRTWAMGLAMGTTLLSSSYQVACNLPNQLYELVMGGMLVTAFLPVYVSLRKREGEERANQYASTLMGIVLVFLGVVALLATLFAPQVVWTQMFFSPSGDRELVVYFFRFFAVQLLFYGVSAVAGGLLNSRSDYFWSSAAPIANNIVVIFAMFVYYFVSADSPDFAKLVLAVGTPLGVFVQMAMQVPALAKNGVHLKPWRINLHDPALRETLALGIPTLVVTLCSFATVSVQNAAAMAVSDAGSSVLYYARQWFTLPYAFLAVPVTTTLFTELAGMVADRDDAAVRRTIISGTQQNFFSMVPFMLYLIVFAVPLVSLFRAGSFDWTSVSLVSGYLAVMALSLPFYACFLFMQKVFSALRAMKQYAVCNLVVSVVQVVLTIVLCLGAGSWSGFGLAGVALAQIAFFVLGTVWCYAYLSKRLGGIGLKTLVGSFVSSLLVGAAGAAVGAVLIWALQAFVMPIEAGGIPWALACIVVGGLASLVVTYGLGVVLHVPGSAFIGRIVARFLPRKAN
ncbi:MAG: murein biosynthesis integral membrane protein MurJ [Coriobacteriaceae bacterium]|nr:murein biosynthesis integral membrane protein MurJ [Coriobacteriaceae bacterium]MDD7112076.1 murein biosynthesis integral membrane protein MurJ [Coriobacteriaceae bacterium]MDY5809617.1 murein biosynthesis integral membrane protein MurJ [Coriobacteriales bacterium]